jgi:anaerobic magnesium-protoporphyrin IX monomethyl ester cyclase
VRVLLVHPPWPDTTRTNFKRRVSGVLPPLGIASIAAVLEQDGHDVRILDAFAEHLTLGAIVSWVSANGPFDVIGISCVTVMAFNAYKIARHVKDEFPDTMVVLGGAHASQLPEESLGVQAVDVVVRGEGEETMRELAAGNPLNMIDGVSYRNEGSCVHNPDRSLIEDLDSLPYPAYHLLPMSKYRPPVGTCRRMPAISMLATRGCPGRCTYCCRLFGSRLRVRSGKSVAEQARMLQQQYGIKEIWFCDDTFTAVRSEVRAFCRTLGELRMDLTWSCFSRIDTFDEETFRMMKASGCHHVMFGVESCNRQILENINKNLDLDMVKYVLQTTREIGLEVRTAFMLGNPGETERTMEETIQYAIELDPDIAVFAISTPFPGTELFEWAEENNLLLTKNWDDYDRSIPVMNLPTVSNELVMDYYRKAHRRFFFRPAYIWKRLKKLGRLEYLSASVRGAVALLKS